MLQLMEEFCDMASQIAEVCDAARAGGKIVLTQTVGYFFHARQRTLSSGSCDRLIPERII